MNRWTELDRAAVPGGGGELRLLRRAEEFSIRLAGYPGDLMNSRLHGSEDELAALACAKLAGRKNPRVLIGGLGMGFTLAAALHQLGPAAEVVVVELVPEVVAWNRGPLGELAAHPLDDPRVTAEIADVTTTIRSARQSFDAIVLDVDNGPEGLTRKANNFLYSTRGLAAAHSALRSKGILAVWSAGPDKGFVRRMQQADFDVESLRIPAHGSKGTRHFIWLGTRR
jgi:spermidine synthase